MVAASQSMVTFPRTREAEGVSDPFAPSVPLSWHYGRLRYADAPDAYRLMRWRERIVETVKRLWYDRGKQPRVSEEPRRVFNDERGDYPSYAEARSHCRTPNCYVVAMPFGRVPFGEELFDNPTFIRPEAEPERDELFANLYADADLRAFMCRELWAENRQLRAAIAAVGAALDEDEHG